jgi:hypothetical protein
MTLVVEGRNMNDVEAWLLATKNPKKNVIAAVRKILLTDKRLSETVKWRAPAFLYGGVMAYFHWSAREFASLIFPHGSRIPGAFTILTGTGIQRVARFQDEKEVRAHRRQLLDIVDAWCDLREHK